MMQGIKAEQVTMRAKPRDDTDANRPGQRGVAKLFASVDVGNVHLDRRQPDRDNRVAQGDGGMSEPRQINQEAICAAFLGRMHKIDQRTLVIALAKLQSHAKRLGTRRQRSLDLCERDLAVNMRFP